MNTHVLSESGSLIQGQNNDFLRMAGAAEDHSLLYREYQRIRESGRIIRNIALLFPPSRQDGARFEFEDGGSESITLPMGSDIASMWVLLEEERRREELSHKERIAQATRSRG